MAISSSLYASISGLNTMGNAMSVLGDNVANVNTIAFKSSRATFQDVLSQSVSTAAGTAQVGRGVTLSTVDGLFAQGSFESTSSATDLAIGGQGFFMLRAADNAAADMYSRAGEFRFDQQGYLVNPVGYYVQGWTIDATSGEVSGTIGDINLGKSTPPVATNSIDVIVNVDSRKANETNDQRLYDAWNGTNAAAVNPTDPIDAANYEYTSAVKVYDSKGASHDITIYFDRTTNDNEWEYLVTCEPSEDLRYLSSTRDQTVYAPNETYNYEEHKGAGALQYGIINFTTAGDIQKISAWDVPPDGNVDISQPDNRLTLDSTDKYYSFDANFTGSTENQQIALNFGARYGGTESAQYQTLVSDAGAYDSLGMSDAITKETLWGSVYDQSANVMSNGDTFFLSGYNHDGTEKSFTYTVDTNTKVSDFLDKVGSAFGATATIDADGRLRLTDNSGGSSGMYITSFSVASATGANPFGAGSSVPGMWSMSSGKLVASDGTTPIANTTTALTNVYDSSRHSFVTGDQLTFGGTDVDGNAVNSTFTVGTTGTTVQNLLDWLETQYQTTAGDVTASLNSDGSIRLVDNTLGGLMAPSFTSITSTTALPLGADATNLITAAQKTSTSAAMYTDAAGLTPVISTTSLAGSYDSSGPPGNMIANGDKFTFSGTSTAGAAVSGTFTVGTSGSTVGSLASWLENLFDPSATGTGNLGVTVNAAGQLLFTDNDATPLGPDATPAMAVGADGGTSTSPVMYSDSALTTFVDGTTLLSGVYDTSGYRVQVGDQFTFTGTDASGGAVNQTYTVGVGDTLNTLCTAMQGWYDPGTTGVTVAINPATGKLEMTDPAGAASTILVNLASVGNTGPLAVTLDSTTQAASSTLPGTFNAQDLHTGQIDISSARTAVVSPGRALSTDSGDPPVVSAGTTWNSVYADPTGPLDPATSGSIVVTGYKGDGTPVSVDYTIDSPTDTVQNFLDALEAKFDADASIDNAGRLVLRDWNTESSYGDTGSQLQITDIDYTNIESIFGPTNTAFERLVGDSQGDGSKVGEMVSSTFETEALASTQYANSSTTIFQDQDGYAAGFLQSVSVDTDGIITGHYSNGQVLEKAQVALASFNNLAGLNKEGGNIFRETTESGAPVTGAPGTNGLGSISPNSLEQSNVDLGTEFVKLITTQRGFQANSKIITTTDEMLSDLINIKR